MPDTFARAAALTLLAAVLAACASTQDTIQQQQEKLQSLGASTRFVADSWLAGETSDTYTRTALDALFRQVEQQRAVLASTPRMLADGTAAALSQQAEQLSRILALMQQDVERQDGAALRRRLGGTPLIPDGQ